MTKKPITGKEFDDLFDDGQDLLHHFDLSKSVRPGVKQKRVNVDFPVWMIQLLDREAKRVGVTRQSIIKVWIADKLKDTVNLEFHFPKSKQ